MQADMAWHESRRRAALLPALSFLFFFCAPHPFDLGFEFCTSGDHGKLEMEAKKEAEPHRRSISAINEDRCYDLLLTALCKDHVRGHFSIYLPFFFFFSSPFLSSLSDGTLLVEQGSGLAYMYETA